MTYKYVIDKRFNTDVIRSDRVLEIAEAFGLGLDNREFVIFDNQPIEVEQGDVIYITGQSGSGKSILLRELSSKMSEKGLQVSDIDGVEFKDEPLINQIGKSTQEALEILSIAGLNDAYLYIRKPQELSDGQKYRFKLAKLIESKAQVWVADEFLAVLDRVTARVIAFNMQKVARRVKATLIVATTHLDMVDDLAPNIYIEKRYREKIHIVTSPEGYKLK
ncbi:adenylyl-sulfate kinase [Ferrovum sp.]|uniref:adenylyl-sulfate kinase n=1 Tax=Ferrovum sp. TaxID=2609467 RepID=UPI00262BE08B|nr:adenylyl-sulfate kinase [Ferrovum sp.]